MYTFSKQLWGLHSPSTCSVQNFQIFTGDNFCHSYTLHTCFRVFSIQLLSKHMLGLKFTNIHESYFFFILTLSTHVSGFTLHTVTLQAHVRFKIYKFSREFIFFILTLSTHISGFTLHTVIWFTLSKHILGSKFSNFHERSFFHAYTLHTCFRVHSPYSYLVYTLQAHVRFKIFKEVHFFHTYTLHTCFRIHSPYSYLVYTLQAHVRFNIFGFSQEIIFSCLHSPLMFQSSLSMQLFLHSPSRCYISKLYIVIIISSCA